MATWHMPQPTSTRRSSWPSSGTPGVGVAWRESGRQMTCRRVSSKERLWMARVEAACHPGLSERFAPFDGSPTLYVTLKPALSMVCLELSEGFLIHRLTCSVRINRFAPLTEHYMQIFSF